MGVSDTLYAFTWPIDVGQSSTPLTSPFGPLLLNSKYDFHPFVDIRTQNSTTFVVSHDWYADWVGENVVFYGLMGFLGEGSYVYASGYAHLTDTVNLNYPSCRFRVAMSETTTQGNISR